MKLKSYTTSNDNNINVYEDMRSIYYLITHIYKLKQILYARKVKLNKEHAAYFKFSMRKVAFHFFFTLLGLILGNRILISGVAFSLFLYFAFSFLKCNGILLQRPYFHFTELWGSAEHN